MNELEKMLIEVFVKEGREAVIRLVEEANLAIPVYDSFFENLVKKSND